MPFTELHGLRLFVPETALFPGLHVAVTTREGGVSQGAYAALNLATHVGDDPVTVAANRDRLEATLRLPSRPCWLRQVHGTAVADADTLGAAHPDGPPVADAAVTRGGAVLAILTADCLPVVIAMPDRAGGEVHFGVAHAGWRGLAAGVLESTVDALERRGGLRPAARAWLGPAIGPSAFEVGDEVRAAFTHDDAGAAAAFLRNPRGRWQADLFLLARRRLTATGVVTVLGGGVCTHSDATHWYSYRRDASAGADTGRFATLVWKGRDTLMPDSPAARAGSSVRCG